jgi:hypothetical protein
VLITYVSVLKSRQNLHSLVLQDVIDKNADTLNNFIESTERHILDHEDMPNHLELSFVRAHTHTHRAERKDYDDVHVDKTSCYI